jgi:cyanophycinase
VSAFLVAAPGHVGLSLAARSALLVRGRRLHSVGESFVAVQLAPSPNRPALRRSLEPNDIADLTALRRAAVSRAGPLFPPENLRDPVLAHGALLIVGGGGFTQEMVARFVELAGGEDARIVIVPTAEENPRLEDRGDAKRFRDAGAREVTTLHTTDRAVAASDEFLAPLRSATGVWFGGGRQWRFIDVYEGTAAYDAFHDVLHRGGIIGGSSAGATIQGEYLVRGHPLGNMEMMAEGYERGFAFLPGVAIDQHFTQRGRRPDMLALKRTFPRLLGLGIDESTALLVQGGTATVLGEHGVSFYDAPLDEDSDRPDHTLLTPGQSYDLKLRRQIVD